MAPGDRLTVDRRGSRDDQVVVLVTKQPVDCLPTSAIVVDPSSVRKRLHHQSSPRRVSCAKGIGATSGRAVVPTTWIASPCRNRP